MKIQKLLGMLVLMAACTGGVDAPDFRELSNEGMIDALTGRYCEHVTDCGEINISCQGVDESMECEGEVVTVSDADCQAGMRPEFERSLGCRAQMSESEVTALETCFDDMDLRSCHGDADLAAAIAAAEDGEAVNEQVPSCASLSELFPPCA